MRIKTALLVLLLFAAALQAATPFSLGQVVVATAGAAVQLGVTTLSGSIVAGATHLTVGSNNAIPRATGAFTFLVQIDSEYFLVTADSTTTWTVTPGQNGSTPAAHSNGATITAKIPMVWMQVRQIVAQASKVYVGTQGLVGSTFVGALAELAANSTGAFNDDSFQLPLLPLSGEQAYSLSSFWVDVQASGNGLIIGGLVP